MIVRNHKVYCYLRLSELEATEKKCRKALDDFIESNSIEVDEIIEEVVSGSVSVVNREKFSRLLTIIKKDDTLITLRLLDLGRYYYETHDVLVDLDDRGIKLCILDLPYFNDWLFIQDERIYHIIFKLLHHLLTDLVALEKKSKTMSVKIGMAEALEHGKRPGHPVTSVPATFKKNYKKFKSGAYGGMCLRDFCKMNGISKTCYYNWEKKLKANGDI